MASDLSSRVQVTVVSTPGAQSTSFSALSETISSGSTSNASDSRSFSASSDHATQTFSPSTIQNSSSETTIAAHISPLDRGRRTALPSNAPPVVVHESQSQYTVDVHLPATIEPEMVTIAAIKGDKMKVVADAWHMESNCHYEWLIAFPPRDIDMSKVHAKFGQDGLLSIDVRRLFYSAHTAS